jgi:hypothetical protein
MGLYRLICEVPKVAPGDPRPYFLGMELTQVEFSADAHEPAVKWVNDYCDTPPVEVISTLTWKPIKVVARRPLELVQVVGVPERTST